MMDREAALRQYYRAVRDCLPCSRKQKLSILRDIQAQVAAYLEECPDADISQIEARFGTPLNIAAAFVDDMRTSELLSSMRLRKRITTSVIAGLLAVLLLWGCGVGFAAARSYSSSNGYTMSAVS